MPLAALLLVVVPAADGAAPLELRDAGGRPLRGPFEGWAKAAQVPLPEGRVRVGLRGCPGRSDLVGCVVTRHPRLIYLRSDARHMRSVFLHELGHVFDLTKLRARDRKAFKRAHGRVGRRWWAGPNSTAEWFAEAYSLCARFGRRLPAGVSTTYSYRPSVRRHRRSCRVMRKAAAEPRRPKPRKQPVAPPTITEPVQTPVPIAPPPPPPPRECVLLILCG